jgi:CheY-like chemotaxis protein
MTTHRRPHILIGDHDRTFLDQLSERLLQMNMEVDLAENGRDAIRLIREEDYDLIICEIAMPLNNGLEVLRKAKEANPGVPVLMLSFAMTKDFAEQSLHEGAYDYILRPLEDIRGFDRAVIKGLKQSETPHGIPSFQSAFEKTRIANRMETPRKPSMLSEKSIAPPDGIHARPVQPAISSMQQKDRSPSAFPQQISKADSFLPDGMLEVNPAGQILNCDSAARKWLELDSKTPERPIKKYLKSLSSRAAPGHILVQFNGHQAHVLRKQIVTQEGKQRIILLFRETQDALATDKMPASAAYRPPQGKSGRTAMDEVSFSDSVKKAPIETYSQGWSPILFFDNVKKTVKGEVNRFLESSQVEWLNQLHRPEPEEVDPEITCAVNHRLSNITGSQKSPYGEVT